MSRWEDVSSHSRSDPYPRTPKSWSLTLGRRGVRVDVTRMLHMEGWYMHCHAFRVETHPLRSTDVEDAKTEALKLAHMVLAEALTACKDALGESP